jgi:ribosomal protein S18 acetylase RimI-like enzyme
MGDTDMTFTELDASQFAEWLIEASAEYIRERIAAGDSPAEAETNAAASFEHLVPGGHRALGQLMGRVHVEGREVGFLWIGPHGTDPTRWWVWDIVIDEAHRRQGHGRAAMVLAEQLAREHGAVSLGLNVFGQNTAARTLYRSLGYEESAIQMRKEL